MSIIIKGVDLPNSGQIELVIRPHGKVFSKTRGISAEAIQIPKDHGRLIDGDKLRKEFSRTESGYCGAWEFCDKPEDMQFLIDDEPTILDKEEE